MKPSGENAQAVLISPEYLHLAVHESLAGCMTVPARAGSEP
jgi:hypothetical protein